MPGAFHTQKTRVFNTRTLVKKIIWTLFYRPGIGKLGQNSFIKSGFHCNDKALLFIRNNTLILNDFRVNFLKEYLSQIFYPRLEIGDNVYIGRACEFVVTDKMTVGDGVVISDSVYINDSNHGFKNIEDELIMDQPLVSKGPISIGNATFIGYRAMILSGVSIGNRCIIAAGAVVTKNVPDDHICFGNPAIMRKRKHV